MAKGKKDDEGKVVDINQVLEDAKTMDEVSSKETADERAQAFLDSLKDDK